MNIILLSGGSGKRLWPLSNDIRSKQFLQLFKGRDGKYESMIQRVYAQLHNIGIPTTVTVATSKLQVSAVYSQLGNDVDVCVEPSRKDTFPAIALSAAYLVDVKKVKPSEAIVACPVDPRVTSEYFRALIALQYQAELEMSNIVLMGIKPTYATDKYGYILTDGDESIKLSPVKSFKEKPSLEKAKEYVESGALWNGGVFAFKLQYVLSKAKEILGYNKYDELLAHYDEFPEVSFDVAVVEKEKSALVMRFAGDWADMGTWNTLTEAMTDKIVGMGVIDESSKGVQIINEMDVPILAMGLSNIVISASPDGILVSDKERSSLIKPFVEDFEEKVKDRQKDSLKQSAEAEPEPEIKQESEQDPEKVDEKVPEVQAETVTDFLSEERKWGSLKVLDVDEDCKILKLTLNENATMEYHSHVNHDEIWVVFEGEGEVILDEKKNNVKKGDIITMKAGCKHTIKAGKKMKMIEIRLGADVSDEDEKQYDLLVALTNAAMRIGNALN